MDQMKNMEQNDIISKASTMLQHIQNMERKFQIEKMKQEQDRKAETVRLQTEKNAEIQKIKDDADKKIKDVERTWSLKTVDDIKSFAKARPKAFDIADVALIQAFFGTDPYRIQSTMRQLSRTLAQSVKPKEFVFVEAQKSKNKAIFKWVEDHGVKYVFVKVDDRSEGLLLKTALWNVGVDNCRSERLCFVDSDVVFENDDWAVKACESLDRYDVVSLARRVRYEEELDYWRNTIGYNFINGNTDGHVGFTLGMKRSAYEKYGRFEAFALHDDMWIWHRILGTKIYKEISGWTPYKTDINMERGLPFDVGYADSEAMHLYHGASDRDRYELFGYVQHIVNRRPFEDIVYDRNKPDIMPVWAENQAGTLVRKAFELIRNSEIPANVRMDPARSLSTAILEQAGVQLHGQAELPIVLTGYREGQSDRGIQPVLDFKEKLEKFCKNNFQLVVVTDAFTTEEAAEHGIDAVPFSSEKIKNDKRLWPAERFSPILQFPEGSVRVWIDMDQEFKREFIIAGDGSAYFC